MYIVCHALSAIASKDVALIIDWIMTKLGRNDPLKFKAILDNCSNGSNLLHN